MSYFFLFFLHSSCQCPFLSILFCILRNVLFPLFCFQFCLYFYNGFIFFFKKISVLSRFLLAYASNSCLQHFPWTLTYLLYCVYVCVFASLCFKKFMAKYLVIFFFFFGICSLEDLSGKWLPTLVFLPEKLHGHRSLAGYSLWGHRKSDTTEHTCRCVAGTQDCPLLLFFLFFPLFSL